MRTKVIILAGLAGCRLFASPGLADKVKQMIGASTTMEHGEAWGSALSELPYNDSTTAQ